MLEWSTRHTETRWSLAGSLDVRCTAELRALVYRLLEEAGSDVHVDISRVDSIDMTTLKMLAVANRVAQRGGHQVILRGGSPGVRRLLHLSHLRSWIPVEPFQTPAPRESVERSRPSTTV